MGVMYYLAREDIRTLFEIGKISPISDLFRELGEAQGIQWEFWPREAPPELELRGLIRVAIDDLCFTIGKDAYAAELARRIVRFADGKPVCLLNDASSDLDRYRADAGDGDLQISDSAYPSEWTQP